MRNNSFKGRGGGGGGGSNDADNLFSTDAFEFVLGISEGPIGGVVGDTPEEKLQNIFVDDTPVFNSVKESNFDNSSLVIRFENGTLISAKEDAEEGQTPIWFGLGGQNIIQQVSSALSYQAPVTRTTVPTVNGFDEIELRFTVSQLVKYTDKGSKKHAVSIRIEYKNLLDDSWYTRNVTIRGKTTVSAFNRSVNILLPRTNPEDQFEIRVTRLTEDSNEEEVAAISWTSYELLTKSGDAYTANGVDYDHPDLEYHPGLAMMHVAGVLGQQMTGIPNVSANYRGIECAIPSNYDPIAKTYNEVQAWDGEFKAKKHWTDNPFWIAYELVTNPSWGMVRYNPRVRINRYTVYRMAKFADGYDLQTNTKNLTNPITGEERAARYTFNAVLTDPQQGWDILRYILGSAFARPIETDSGEIKFIADLPDLPVATIVPEMCVTTQEGSPFNYNFSAISERHNAVTSSYYDAVMNYEKQFVSEIRDEDSIAKYGLNPYEFDAVGATDIWEVKRRMTFYISSVTTEVKTVTFSCPTFGMALEPMDIINIVDPETGHAYSGRATKLTNKSVTLRDPIYFDEAGDYNVKVMGKFEDYDLTTEVLAKDLEKPIYRLKLKEALPEAKMFNKYPPVVISASQQGQLIGLPKPWRVITVEESQDLPEVYNFVCQEVNLNKHYDADNLVISETPQYSFLLRPQVRKVTNLRVVDEEHSQIRGVEQINLWIAWDIQAPLPPGGYFEVRVTEESVNGREFTTKTNNQYFEIQNVKLGEITIEVRSAQGDTFSPWVELQWATTLVSANDLRDQAVNPEISITYENHALTIESRVMYEFGSSEIHRVDLLETNGILGIQFKIYNDIDPDNRELLITKVAKSLLLITKSDLEVAMSGEEPPANLYITARMVDLTGEFYPDLFTEPLSYRVSTPVEPVRTLRYQYVFSNEEPHLFTWDDENYAYQVTLYKPDGRTVIATQKTYDSSIVFGFLAAATGYILRVKGISSTLEFGNPTTLQFNVTAPPTPPESPTITNEGGVITLTPPKVDTTTSYYEFKYHGENVFSEAKDFSNGSSITLYAQSSGQEFNIWYRLSSKEGFGVWVHHVVIATEAFSVDLDEVLDDILNNENAPWGQSLANTVNQIIADIDTWEDQVTALGDEYQLLDLEQTYLRDDLDLLDLDVVALRTDIGDKSVQTQISESNSLQIGYEDENGDWIVGAPIARSLREVKIRNSAGEEISVVNYMQALEDALGEVGGGYYLGVVDEETTFTGLEITAGSGASSIKLYMDNLTFANKAGVDFFTYDSNTNKLVMSSEVEVRGTLVSTRKVTITANVMEIEDPEGFGPDNLWIWKGVPILNGTEPAYDSLTKQNASLGWRDLDGNEYFGGSVTTGELINGGDSTLLTLNPSVEVGPFTTNGNAKTVSFSISWGGTYSWDEACPTNQTFVPSATLILERSTGGSDWVEIQTKNMTGDVTYREFDDQEHGVTTCTMVERSGAAFTFTDTNASMGNFMYRLRVTNQQRALVQQFIDYQRLSLVIVESRPN